MMPIPILMNESCLTKPSPEYRVCIIGNKSVKAIYKKLEADNINTYGITDCDCSRAI